MNGATGDKLAPSLGVWYVGKGVAMKQLMLYYSYVV